MEITPSLLEIPGAPLPEENPLPMFRSRQHDLDIASNGTLSQQELDGLGKHGGFRVLPYGMQDRYTRQRSMRQYPAIVMENDKLRAVFLPQFGGRLYSLYSKEHGQELLFKNPVFQPANLAIRNAWFSGGIEWNVGQLGHAYHTCDDVYFAKCQAKGETFLRMYDYVRTTGLFWQIDFHLPEGSSFLYAHVRIINDGKQAQPLYWWTNTAVPEQGARIFSGSENIIYIDPKSLVKEGQPHGYGHGIMPTLSRMPGVDISYPEAFDYTSEYFFQNTSDDPSPWEASVYPQGVSFLERSTQPLKTRKMFCWGQHSGGRNWQDHLTEPGKGAYVEIQAGLTPTQSHGADLPAHREISFTQAFGSFDASALRDGIWQESCAKIQHLADQVLPPQVIQALHQDYAAMADVPCGTLLHKGHGWGALEAMRREICKEPGIPAQLTFEREGTKEEEPWLALLEGKKLPPILPGQLPRSWMVDPAWRALLQKAIEQDPQNPAGLIYLGVLEFENENDQAARTLWEMANEIQPTVIALRCLALALERDGQEQAALAAMGEAFRLEEENTVPVTREYFAMLQKAGRFQEMWELYTSLPESVSQDERVMILASAAALELGQEDFLEQVYRHTFAVIREGENQLCEIWFRHQAMKAARNQEGADLEALTQQMRQTLTPPKTIDYRLAQA